MLAETKFLVIFSYLFSLFVKHGLVFYIFSTSQMLQFSKNIQCGTIT